MLLILVAEEVEEVGAVECLGLFLRFVCGGGLGAFMQMPVETRRGRWFPLKLYMMKTTSGLHKNSRHSGPLQRLPHLPHDVVCLFLGYNKMF